MATKKEDGQAKTSRPARKPVTIDLEAKDVKEVTAPGAAPEAKATDAKADTTKPTESKPAENTPGDAKPGDAKLAASAKPEPAKSEPAKTGPESKTGADAAKAGPATESKSGGDAAVGVKDPAAPKSAAQTAEKAAESAKPDTKAPISRDETPKKDEPKRPEPTLGAASAPKGEKRGGLIGWFAAALAGGVVAFGAGYGLQSAGVLPAPGAPSETVAPADLAALTTRTADLEGKLAELGARPAPEASVPADLSETLTALAARVEAMEKTIAALPDPAAAVEARIAEVEKKAAGLDELTGQVADLRRLVSSGTQGPEVALESLQGELTDLRGKIAAVAETASAVPAVDPALGDAIKGVETTIAGLNETVSAQAARLDGVEAKLAEAGADEATKSAIGAVETRVGELATAAEARDAVLTAATAKAEETAAALSGVGEQITELAGKVDAAAGRIDGLEKTVGGPGAREIAARAVAVSSLGRAVEAGKPYQAELAAVSATLGEGVDLSPLAAHAEKGIATTSALVAGFPAAADKVRATLAKPAEDAGVLDRLWSNAQSAVQVRATGEGAGAGVDAALGEMGRKAAAGDLAGAVAAWDALGEADVSAEAKAAIEPWLSAVRARLAADRLVETVTGDVLSLLAESGN
ncbi:MAG: hypothetical protein C0606_08380 [Hyphomicrobiales bacterium]|nr:MAG: hypothetical protein C0606_08380 [Hyphomicrobiales bacterium]